MPLCDGNSEDHCCYLNGSLCPFLEEGTIEGRRWVCGLRRELGSWDSVHTDSRYVEIVRPVWDEAGIIDCGYWPGPGTKCSSCGVNGDG